VFKCIPTDSVKTFASLRKYQEELPLAKTDPELAANRANDIQVVFPFLLHLTISLLE